MFAASRTSSTLRSEILIYPPLLSLCACTFVQSFPGSLVMRVGVMLLYGREYPRAIHSGAGGRVRGPAAGGRVRAERRTAAAGHEPPRADTRPGTYRAGWRGPLRSGGRGSAAVQAAALRLRPGAG